jgi:hypothetical protein
MKALIVVLLTLWLWPLTILAQSNDCLSIIKSRSEQITSSQNTNGSGDCLSRIQSRSQELGLMESNSVPDVSSDQPESNTDCLDEIVKRSQDMEKESVSDGSQPDTPSKSKPASDNSTAITGVSWPSNQSLPVDSPFKQVINDSKASILPKENKFIHNVVGVSRPIKKIWKKIFPRKKISSDLSFNPADYDEVAAWAKKNGKVETMRSVEKKYGAQIQELSKEFGVDPNVIIAIVAHESGGDPNAYNKSGASGLMQLMPCTYSAYGLNSVTVFDPYQNLLAGIHCFSDMMKMFGNVKDGIYAYGTGHSRAQKNLKKGIESDEVRFVQEVLYLAQN